MKEAALFERLAGDQVQCHLCAHGCVIPSGHAGICRVRENGGGTLYTRTYGRTISQHVDPIEKKPLFHVHPGSLAYSIAAPGCNFRCRWCQNFEISQADHEWHFTAGQTASPEQIVLLAQRARCQSIAYTYTEPTVFFEYAYDTAKLAHAAGILNIFVTNGYMTAGALDAIQPYLNAANVDLKAFRDETYRKYIGARLQPVLETLKRMKQLGIWVEVTTLVIPSVNDSEAELRDIAQFIAGELGVETPWHVSRFHPMYEMMDVPATPAATLHMAHAIGVEAGLQFVYVGNMAGDGENTACPTCGKMLIHRSGYRILSNSVRDGRCPGCNAVIAGLGISGV
jgi:pyruvate formate lyase activating enzyme